MTSRTNPAGYDSYVHQVQSLAARSGQLTQELAGLEAASTDSVNEALHRERSTRERLATADQRLGRLERDIAGLTARASVSEPVQTQPVRLTDLSEVESFLRALTSDTESARAAWEWVERARSQQPAAPPSPSVQTYEPPTAHGKDARGHHAAPAAPQTSSGRRVPFLVGAALLLAVLVLLIAKAL